VVNQLSARYRHCGVSVGCQTATIGLVRVHHAADTRKKRAPGRPCTTDLGVVKQRDASRLEKHPEIDLDEKGDAGCRVVLLNADTYTSARHAQV
jgi:hypothetical protein